MKNFSRREFLTGAGFALASLVTGCSLSKAPALVKDAARTVTGDKTLYVDYPRQIVAARNHNARTVMWQTAEPLAAPKLELRLKGDRARTAFTPTGAEFTDDNRTAMLYTAPLYPLAAGRAYEYRVTDGELATAWHPLKTDGGPGESFSCLIFPDSQSSDYTDWRNLARQAYERNKDAAFFINMGDLVDNGEDHSQWDDWFDAVQPLLNDIPVAPVMGNHETYDNKWEVRLPKAYLANFPVPGNGNRKFDRYYYSFDWGDAHFVALNTQWPELGEFTDGLIDEQLAWLRADLKQTKQKWRIALLHRDVLRYAIHGRPERLPGVDQVGEIFMPLFDEYEFDLVFTAHLHTYRNRGQLYHLQRRDMGPFYILTGVAGNVRYPNLWIDHEFDKVIAPQPETGNYLTLHISPQELAVHTYLPDGKMIDRLMIGK